MAAAVGSLIILAALSPAVSRYLLLLGSCASLKYAKKKSKLGLYRERKIKYQVRLQQHFICFRVSLCVSFILTRTMVQKFLQLERPSLLQVNFDARFALFVDNFERHFQILNIFVRISGQVKRKRWVSKESDVWVDSYFLPINLLASKTVRVGLEVAWFLQHLDQTLRIRKCNVRWSNPIALVICDYFNFPINVCSHAWVRSTQIDSDHGTELFTGVVGERW